MKMPARALLSAILASVRIRHGLNDDAVARRRFADGIIIQVSDRVAWVAGNGGFQPTVIKLPAPR
jgi:hypothetical protein